MFPASFAYAAPRTLAEAIALLVEHGDDAKALAGGCSLIPAMKLRLAEPHVLIDLRHAVPAGIARQGKELHIGGMTRESSIEQSALVRQLLPALAETSSVIADPVVRNMGTLGGNIAHADPANDHPAMLLALGADVVVRGPDGERRLPIDDLFVDLYTTALQQGELITAIVIPLPQGGSGSAYEKLERQVGDFAIVGVAVSIAVQDGTIASARIAVTNMAATAVRAPAAEAALIGQAPGAPAFAVAAALIATGLEPWDELRGSAAYKRSVLPAVARRALLRAWTRAESAPVERVA